MKGYDRISLVDRCESVKITFHDSSFPFRSDIDTYKVESFWRKKSSDNPTLFDGPLLLASHLGGNDLNLHLYNSTYSMYLYAVENHVFPQNSGAFGFKCLIKYKSSYLIGQRSRAVSVDPLFWSSPGGTFEPSLSNCSEMKNQIRGELSEELGTSFGGERIDLIGIGTVYRVGVNIIARIDLENEFSEDFVRSNYEWSRPPTWCKQNQIPELSPRTPELDHVVDGLF